MVDGLVHTPQSLVRTMEIASVIGIEDSGGVVIKRKKPSDCHEAPLRAKSEHDLQMHCPNSQAGENCSPHLYCLVQVKSVIWAEEVYYCMGEGRQMDSSPRWGKISQHL